MEGLTEELPTKKIKEMTAKIDQYMQIEKNKVME
jgi:hypothetical protein